MLQTLPRWPRAIAIVASILIALMATLGAVIAFGTAAPPRPVQPRQLDLTDLPALSRYTARDGTQLAYRAYPSGGEQVAVLIHGTGTESSVMNALAMTLHAAGATVYAPDLRGHGSSGRRGDIDYIGQLDDDLDDDLADLVATIRPEHAHATGGWATPYLPRIVGLMILNKIGIHWFDGLDAIIFAIPPGNQNLTGVYSFRLAMNLGSNDYFAALQRTKKPMALIAGGNDDQFYADRYAPLLQPAKPDLTVELVPGLDHVDMLMKPAALAALRRTFDAMPR
jgi:non-heme chloroperoxidase